MIQLHAALASDRGRKRPHNEDYVTYFEPADIEVVQASGNLYVLADGVGGSMHGERASRYAAQKVLHAYYQEAESLPGERLETAVQQASADIYNYARQEMEFGRMATTLVAAAIRQGSVTVANVGDSRAYLLRAGELQQITRDHTYAGELLRAGVLSAEEAARAKGLNRLTRSVGGRESVEVDRFENISLQPGDRLLLCSDGLTRYASNNDLTRLASVSPLEAAVAEMIAFANDAGGADNISAILIEVRDSQESNPTTGAALRGQTPDPVDIAALGPPPGGASSSARRLWRYEESRSLLPLILFLLLAAALCILAVILVVKFFTLRIGSGLSLASTALFPGSLSMMIFLGIRLAEAGEIFAGKGGRA